MQKIPNIPPSANSAIRGRSSGSGTSAPQAFQIVQLMLLFVVPQILLCGLFDLSASPEWLQVVSACLPLTYGVDAMQQVMLAGAGFADIWFDLAIVWAFIVVFFSLASLRFTKKRAKKTTKLSSFKVDIQSL